MDIHYVGIRLSTIFGGSGGTAGTLTTVVKDSDENDFTVSNRVYGAGNNSFLVAADVKNSDADDFTVFT